MNICIICIGSNYHRKENLLTARGKLQKSFPTIRFASEMETEPFNLKNTALFSNQMALFTSDLEEEYITNILKKIESEAGRHPEDKAEERICLDIDLLMYNEKCLKPEDVKRGYIQEGLKELTERL